MRKLEELIQQYCPKGVKYKKTGEVFDTCTDYTAAGSFADIAKNVQYLSEKDYALLVRTMDIKSRFSKGNAIYINNHAYEYLWRVHFDKPCIVMPNIGNCGEVYYIEPSMIPYDKAALAPNAIMLNSSTENVKYLSYVLQSVEFQKALHKIVSPVGQTKFNKTDFKSLEIPVPPHPVQEEIVRILDKFTELEKGLEVELELRKKQFVGLQQRLLSKDCFDQFVTADSICDIEKGNTPIQKARSGEYPLVVTTSERKSCDTYQFDRPAVCIPLVSSRGHGVASLNHVYYQEGKFALGNILCAVMPRSYDRLNCRFLYHYLEYQKDTMLVPLMKGGANVAMHKMDIETLRIPIVDIDTQNYIVSCLDKYLELITCLKSEIEMRYLQYEYYGKRLFSFGIVNDDFDI